MKVNTSLEFRRFRTRELQRMTGRPLYPAQSEARLGVREPLALETATIPSRLKRPFHWRPSILVNLRFS